MSTNGLGTTPPPRLLGALDHVWQANASLVNQFALTVVRPHIEQHYGVWTVPVASGNQAGSGYDLTRALNSLQEQVESAAQVPVTILLDH